MPQAGGPAALNGFLYQILHHLAWLAQLHLTGTVNGKSLAHALLVLEPRTGGDARAEGRGVFLVEQYKTRNGGTWATADIESVLGDLRKAVPRPRPKNPRYRFVTDGRRGRLNAFDTFLANVKAAKRPADLTDRKARKFSSTASMTDARYLRHLTKATRPAGLASKTPKSPVSEKELALVFHLLAHFEIQYGSSAAHRTREVEAQLRRYAPDLGDERKARQHLVGLIFECLSRGEQALDLQAINELFKQAGLSPDRMRHLAALPSSLAARLNHHLVRFKYNSALDVRVPPSWSSGKPVLVIEGPSGGGKTWQLAHLLKRAAADGALTVLLSADAPAEDLLTRAARTIWQSGLQETSDKTLTAVAQFLRDFSSGQPASPIVIAVDDVRDIDVARGLVRQDWEALSIRLVMTTPHNIANALILSDGNVLHAHSVTHFSTQELDTLLSRRRRAWAHLPSDLKRLLRTPILAGIYLELSSTSTGWTPHTEYEIFDHLWLRISAGGASGDEGIVLALAGHMLEHQARSLRREHWSNLGLTSDAIAARLTATGWVAILDSGEIEFTHDRLLNWAVAKELTRRLQRRAIASQDLVQRIVRAPTGQAVPESHLAYVPMDLLWLFAGDAAHAQIAGLLLEHMERSGDYGPDGGQLYALLLPTLGARALPLLQERLKKAPDDRAGRYYASILATTLVALSRQDGVDVQQLLTQLISSNSRARQSIALTVLTVQPDPRHLDRIWELHRRHSAELQDSTRDLRHTDYDISFAALKSATARDPFWLQNRILAADPRQEPVHELAYQLNALDSGKASSIWQATVATLLKKVPLDKPRSLLFCIARFKDRQRLDFIQQHLFTQGSNGGAALIALARLEPRKALEQLSSVDDLTRSMFRSRWLPLVLRAAADQTRAQILQLAQTRGRRVIEDLFVERTGDMGPGLLEFELTALQKDLNQHLTAAPDTEPLWLYAALKFIGTISHPELLPRLHSLAKGPLEEMIAKVAISRVPHSSQHRDRVLESARLVLILSAAEHLTELLAAELDSNDLWARHSGLLHAFMRSDPQIIQRLVAIAGQPAATLTAQSPPNEESLERCLAFAALAHLGSDSDLIQALQLAGPEELPSTLADLRAHRGPIPTHLTSPQMTALSDPAASDAARLRALVVALISADSTWIPLVRSTLEHTDPASLTARYACIALLQLGDRTESFITLCEALLYTEGNSAIALDALLAIGAPAIDSLARWVASLTNASTARTERLDTAIRALHAHSPTRQQAINTAVVLGLHDIAAEQDDPALREHIIETAFPVGRPVDQDTLLAIEGLAKFDPDRATHAIEHALRSNGSHVTPACHLLIRILQTAADEILIRQALSHDHKPLTDIIGRSLRLVDATEVSAHLIQYMSGGTLSQRKVATQLAAWINTPVLQTQLQQLAEHDSSDEVRGAASTALESQARLTHLEALIDLLPATKGNQRWSVLTAILHSGDPYVLSTPRDPLCIDQPLARLPAICQYYAEQVIHNRKQL